MAANPFLTIADDGVPLVELKQGLVLYLARPPTLDAVRRTYEHYMQLCGSQVRSFRSTAPGWLPRDWDRDAREWFERDRLPNLYRQMDWGWAFSDGQDVDSWMFMFHGYRPRSQPGKASFFRLDFDWKVNPEFVWALADRLIGYTEFIWGFAGYYLQGRADLRYLSNSFDLVYAIAQRYWGAEAHNLDVTVDYAMNGFKCVNWLTCIGNALGARAPEALDRARVAAYDSHRSAFGEMFRAQIYPVLGDRNRRERMDGYVALARALEPLQTSTHRAFGGERWTDENVMQYLRRFTPASP